MTKRFGFTLAEVLITLGIIGVVAAMTIPTLISNTNGAQFKTAYKKALSTLNQAIVMNVALADTDFSSLVEVDGNVGANDNLMSTILEERMQNAKDTSSAYFGSGTSATTFTPATVTMKVSCTQTDITNAKEGDLCAGKNIAEGKTSVDAEGSVSFAPNSTDYVVYSFADGTTFGYNKNAKRCSVKGAADCYGFIDVNGATGPNTVINCAKAAAAQGSTCESSEITDIYPVIFYGQTVEPASDSARAVLFGK